jgi:polysaccharide export outer membrane protein
MIRKWIGLSMYALLLSACGSTKEISYLQDMNVVRMLTIKQKYEAIIHQNDLLSIYVNSKNPELTAPFNMPVAFSQVGVDVSSSQRVLGYLVDVNGDIDFPMLGKIPVEGLTRLQLTDLIKNWLTRDNLIKDPIVTVQFLNFRVSVMGEVNHPGSFTITGDRVTLLDALSMAGDLTIYGKRNRVAVIREDQNERTIMFHDLRSVNIFASPCYYLQQNDIVYVEPNRARAAQSHINQNNSVGVWLSAISILTSVVALMVNLNK